MGARRWAEKEREEGGNGNLCRSVTGKKVEGGGGEKEHDLEGPLSYEEKEEERDPELPFLSPPPFAYSVFVSSPYFLLPQKKGERKGNFAPPPKSPKKVHRMGKIGMERDIPPSLGKGENGVSEGSDEEKEKTLHICRHISVPSLLFLPMHENGQ